MQRLNVWAWFLGSRPTFWGRFYRGGVLLFGLLAFIASWWIATISLGGVGFMLGWLPCIIIAVMAGFAWPLLTVGGAATAAVIYLQWAAQQQKSNWWDQDVTVATAAELKTAQDSAALADLCRQVPPSWKRYLKPVDASAPLPTTPWDKAAAENIETARLQEDRLLKFIAIVRAKCRLAAFAN